MDKLNKRFYKGDILKASDINDIINKIKELATSKSISVNIDTVKSNDKLSYTEINNVVTQVNKLREYANLSKLDLNFKYLELLYASELNKITAAIDDLIEDSNFIPEVQTSQLSIFFATDLGSNPENNYYYCAKFGQEWPKDVTWSVSENSYVKIKPSSSSCYCMVEVLEGAQNQSITLTASFVKNGTRYINSRTLSGLTYSKQILNVEYLIFNKYHNAFKVTFKDKVTLNPSRGFNLNVGNTTMCSTNGIEDPTNDHVLYFTQKLIPESEWNGSYVKCNIREGYIYLNDEPTTYTYYEWGCSVPFCKGVGSITGNTNISNNTTVTYGAISDPTDCPLRIKWSIVSGADCADIVLDYSYDNSNDKPSQYVNPAYTDKVDASKFTTCKLTSKKAGTVVLKAQGIMWNDTISDRTSRWMEWGDPKTITITIS